VCLLLSCLDRSYALCLKQAVRGCRKLGHLSHLGILQTQGENLYCIQMGFFRLVFSRICLFNNWDIPNTVLNLVLTLLIETREHYTAWLSAEILRGRWNRLFAFVLSFLTALPSLSSASCSHLDLEFMFSIFSDILMCEKSIWNPDYKFNILAFE